MRPLNEFIMTLMAAISLYISVDLWRQTPDACFGRILDHEAGEQCRH